MSAPPWERRRILVWGKTRPEVSGKYRETVCTGGVFADTRTLVRLYPIPLRYLNDQQVFRKYQWIDAMVQRASDRDARPESYRIRTDQSLGLGDVIDSEKGRWTERAKWILHPSVVVDSVESLQQEQKQTSRSLGLLRPGRIEGFRAVRVPRDERDQQWVRYREILANEPLPYEDVQPVRPLPPADFRYKVRFQCDESRCTGHEFSILDWELDALYGRMRQHDRAPDLAARLVVEKLEQYCGPDRDARFYLGNISTHPHVFTVVGLWHPKKEARPDGRRQGALFDDPSMG